MFVFSFLSFFISFQKIKKLDDTKNEKLKTYFHKVLTFETIQLLDFLKTNKK
jgi:hypothetical protein